MIGTGSAVQGAVGFVYGGGVLFESGPEICGTQCRPTSSQGEVGICLLHAVRRLHGGLLVVKKGFLGLKVMGEKRL